MDLPPAPAADASGEVPPPPVDGGASMETPPAEGGEDEDGGKRSSYMAEAQKYAGKLGQELRDLHDRMESDDIKYILNMVISAVDLDKLSDEDIEDIATKFEREEEEGGMGSEEPTGEEPAPSPEEAPSDMNEYDSMSALDEFVNTPMDTNEPSDVQDIDLSKYAIKEEGDEEVDETQELDLEEMKSEINNAIGSTLSKYFK